MDIIVKKPNEIEPEVFQNFHKLIEEHSKIQLEGLQERIARAKYLSLAIEDSQIVAIRAIKCPDTGYVKAIFYHAGVPQLYPYYRFETGWSVTLPEHRCKGLSSILLKELLSRVRDNVYSTTRISNHPPHKILTKNGFVRMERKFAGREEPLFLWLYNYQTNQWRITGWV